MARTNRTIDATVDQIDEAKQTALALLDDSPMQRTIDSLFYEKDLKVIESGIKRLNDFSNKSWLLSALLLHSIVYDKGLYSQSGLDWAAYSASARERFGLDQREISEQLSAARFFVKHHNALIRYGWNPNVPRHNLSTAELAYDLCGNIDEVISHLVSDSMRGFRDWYQSFKKQKKLGVQSEFIRNDIEIKKGKCYIGKVEAVKVSDKIPESDRVRLQEYIEQIFEAWRHGDELAIVPVYDKKEAAIIPRLRDKYRAKK